MLPCVGHRLERTDPVIPHQREAQSRHGEPEKRLGNIDSFLPDSFKKRKGGQRMWRDTIIEEDNRIVATGDNVRMNTREIADLFNITAASVNRAPIFPELTNGWLIRISLFLFDIQKIWVK